MFFKTIKSKLHGYKYRFVPWVLLNWRKRPVKQISWLENESLNLQRKHVSVLRDFFEQLHAGNGSPENMMISQFGFLVKKEKSKIANAGTGVVVQSGNVKALSIVALYPGTVYYPMEPIFFQSLGNSFILKCIDGVIIDGNDQGLSKRIYKSSAGRDTIGAHSTCDTSWLTKKLLNPLSLGQYVNNCTSEFPANVTYQEVDIPVDFPLHLLKYIPNVHFKMQMNSETVYEKSRYIRTVVLLTLRDINEGEELFSSYYTQIERNE